MRTLLLASLLLALAGPAGAVDSQPYSLEKDSEFEYGCFGPCACPVLIRVGVYGGFDLTPRLPEGTFHVYDVTGVSWIVPDGGDGTAVTGQGTYRYGGASGDQEQLTLTLRVGSGAPRVYDSGLVTKTVPFPAIDLDITAPSEGCFDTVFAVHASPATVGGDLTLEGGSFGIHSIRPNPMLGSVVVDFALPQAATASLVVFDARGRRRATLIGERWLDSGPLQVRWTGTDEEGRPLSAGIYWLELVSGGRRDVQRMVKLQP